MIPEVKRAIDRVGVEVREDLGLEALRAMGLYVYDDVYLMSYLGTYQRGTRCMLRYIYT